MVSINHPYVKLITDYCKERGLSLEQAAYVLATAHHETGQFRWLREIWGPTPAQRRYEGRKDLGNTVTGDGKRFMGRGFVQITGRRNYTDWAKRLGVDIVAKPDLAEKPDIAVRILVEGMQLGTFTGRSMSDYIYGKTVDYEGARRVVNGTDKKDTIAGYARSFEKALKEAGYSVAPAQGGAEPKPAPPKRASEPFPVVNEGGWATALCNVLVAIFKKGK